MASDAVSSTRISRIVGYLLSKGNFALSSPNLPQRIAVFAEANEAQQSILDLDPVELTSAQQAGQLYGFGSPMYLIMRILRPLSGDGVAGIPVIAYPQAKAVGSTAKILTVTPSGTATGNGTHYLKVAGRDVLDGNFYAINIESGDTTADITEKIEDAINNILGCPFSATSTDYEATATSKWRGLTAEGLSISVDTGDSDLGITYSVVSTQTASGTPSVAAALALFGNNWNTIVVNSYGAISAIMTSLEGFNGIPSPTAPIGRYAATIMKPFIAITGSVLEDPTSLTNGRLNDVTIALAPAPLSAGLALEAAANMTLLYAKQAQDNPHLDVAGQSYPDMPTPSDIGDMSSYDSRDAFVKLGSSTVDLVAGRYQVQDFVTTYHPIGEVPPQFRYVRNLNIDMNIRYTYYLSELINVADHAIANDDDVVTAVSVVKPKIWKGILIKMAVDLEKRALIVDSDFMKASLDVNIGTSNPDRLETFFRYKRSGFARISSTTAEAGFNFGILT